MNNIIEINNIPSLPLPYISDEDAPIYNEGKRWSFSNIYSLLDLRNIYLIVVSSSSKTLKAITGLVKENIEEKPDQWNERKVLEYLNALVNFKMLNADYSVKEICFEGRELDEPLNEEDIFVFKKIFFTYFRFKEMASWFISPDFHESFESVSEELLSEKSVPIFFLANQNRFVDTILYSLTSKENFRYVMDDSMTHQMRFWDVFLKWGTTLGVIDKFNLSRNDFKISEKKDISMAYFIKPFVPFDLVDFIESSDTFSSREIYMPDLIFELAFQFRFSVNKLKSHIISELESNSKLTYERTSKIFIIKGKESEKKIKDATYLFPIIEDSFVSHIILRK